MESAVSHRTLAPLLSAPAARASWPAGVWRRIAASLAFTLPLTGLALWAYHRGYIDPALLALAHRADLVQAEGGLRYAYPPVPTVIAIMFSGGTLALSIATAVFAGITLQLLFGIVLKMVSVVTTVIMICTLAAIPAMWYLETQRLPTMAGLLFMSAAVYYIVRFEAYGDVESGFFAGLALAAAFCCEPFAILFVVAGTLAAPLVADPAYRRDPVAATATMTVIAYPIVAVATGWIFLQWKFAGVFPGQYNPSPGFLAFPHGIRGGLAAAAWATAIDVLHAPSYLIFGALLWRRRPDVFPGYASVLLPFAIALWLGLSYPQIAAYFAFTVLALLAPLHFRDDATTWKTQMILICGSIAQVIVGIVWPPSAASVTAWWHAIT